MKKTYFITIVCNKTHKVQHLMRPEERIDETINKELGGESNLFSTRISSTSGLSQETGTTKDGSKSFSILCVVGEPTF